MKNRKLLNCIVAVILIFSVLFSQFVFSPLTLQVSADEIVKWSGNAAAGFAGGYGTAEAPYLIENADQLYKMVVEYHTREASMGKYFKITEDIYINDVSDGKHVKELKNKLNWLLSYGDIIAAASKANAFVGSLDGDGHTIYGLYATSTDKISMGLFPAIDTTAVIKNLSFDNVYIHGGGGYGGAIAGRAYWHTTATPAKITNCSVTNAIIGDGNNLEYAAGFIGDTLDCTITFTNCYASNISLSNWVDRGTPGAFTGNSYSTSGTLTFNNCYSVDYFPTNSNISKAKCTNVYTNAAIPDGNTTAGVTVYEAANMQGEAAKTNFTGFDFVWVWQTVNNDYPTFRDEVIEVWDKSVEVTGFTGFKGTGTASDPYQIENGSQLAFVVSNDIVTLKRSEIAGTTDFYFKLVKDIRLNDTTDANWKESANLNSWVWGDVRFSGNFDGDGHTIDGLYDNRTKDKFGLFSYVGLSNDGTIPTTIKNLKITNASVTNGGSNGVGILAGQTSGATTFEKIYIDETCTLSAPSAKGVAGISGFGNGKTPVIIRDCAVLATISGSTQVAAFAGAYWSSDSVTITGSFSSSEGLKLSYKALVNSWNNYARVADTYGTVALEPEQMQGEAAKTNMPGLSFGFDWEVVENGYPVHIPNTVEIWDGTTAENYAGNGDGSKENPYLIENGAQLLKMVKENTASTGDSTFTEPKHFKITKDIYLNKVTLGDVKEPTVDSWNSKGFNAWDPGYLYTANTGFCGVIDGGGHTIHGLYCKEGTYGGLLPNVVDSAVVKNLNVKNSYVRTGGNGGPGVIIGVVNGGTNNRSTATVSYCSVDNCYVASEGTGSWRCGAIVGGGYNEGKITVTNCAVTRVTMTVANPDSVDRSCAFIGNTSNSGHEITNCYTDSSTHPVTNAKDGGDYTGVYHYDTIHKSKVFTNVYTSAERPEYYDDLADKYKDVIIYLEDEQMKGENAKTYMPTLYFGRYWKTVKNDYPALVYYNAPAYVWDGLKVNSLEDFKGDGSKEHPYLIETPQQLAYIVSTDIDGIFNYKLMNDMYLNDTSDPNWTMDARNWAYGAIRFEGNFDGNGHTIDGLYFNGAQKRFGLFSFVGDANIGNFKMTNAYIYNTCQEIASDASNDEGISFVVGQTSAWANFDRIYIDETCYLEAPYGVGVGGIVGRGSVDVNITNSAVLGDIHGLNKVGAFFGDYWGGAQTIGSSFTTSNVPVMTSRSLQASGNFYATVKDPADSPKDTGVTILSEEEMKGENAKVNMPGLDYYFTWETVANSYPVFKNDASIEFWGGKVADTATIEYAGGNGTKASPFQIANGDQLYKMVAENSNANLYTAATEQKYFEIVADINLAYKKWYTNSVNNWFTNANYDNVGFNGVIYGNGHTIYNLYSSASAGATGLIPVATQLAEIHDLHIKGGNSFATYGAGAFIGLAKAKERTKPVILKGCSVENFSAKAANGTGGLIGYVYSQPFNIIDCRVTNTNLTVTAATSSNTAAFVGYLDGSDTGNNFVFENSYCDDLNPLVNIKDSFKEETIFKNVYTLNEGYDNSTDGLKKVSPAEITGDTAKDTLTDFNFNQVWKTVENGYPVHYSPEEKATLWDGRAAGAFAGGRGTSEEPYLISNASQLYLLASSYDRNLTHGKYYELTNDIVISRVYDNWQDENPYSWASQKALLDGFTYTDGSFAGVLDGAGYTVSGLYYDDEITNNGTYAYGLIPFVSSKAVIKNLKVENVNISTSGNAYVGAVSGAVHVTTDDVNDILNYVNFVNINVDNVNINQNNSNTVLGYANRGVKFIACNGETIATNDEAKIFNFDISVSKDAVVCSNLYSKAEILSAVRQTILVEGKNDICDINGIDGLNIIDLIEVKKTMYLEKPEESLVWSQEFNGDKLDYSVWSQNTAMSLGTTLQYADNSTVSDNKLTLQCKDTGTKNANEKTIYSVNYGLDTLSSMSFKYGRLEMCAKIPFYAGAFPSLWLSSRNAFGYEKLSPYSTEVDIFEVFGNGESDLNWDGFTNNNNQMVACIHKWYNDAEGNKLLNADEKPIECSCGTPEENGNGYNISESDRDKVFNTDSQKTDWHTIVFEWTEDTMTFKVDGELYYTANRSEMDNFDLSDMNTDSDGIFNQYLSICLNNHMYTKGGAYEYTGSGNIDPTKLNYEIDYIRLYQKNDGKSEIILK